MSFKAVNWAFELKMGDAQTKLVLLALCNHADENDLCWPSQERLAEKSCCSVDTVQRRLNYLENAGLVRVRRRRRKSSIYQLMLNKKSLKPQPAASRNLETAELFLDTANPGLETAIGAVGISNMNLQLESNAPSARDGQPTNEPDDIEPINEPPKARLFRKGKTALVSLGLSEERSGSVIGRWLKDKHDPVGILAAIEYARQQCAVSPVAYVTQILKGQTDGKTKNGIDDRIRELADQAREIERDAGIVRPDDRF